MNCRDCRYCATTPYGNRWVCTIGDNLKFVDVIEKEGVYPCATVKSAISQATAKKGTALDALLKSQSVKGY